MGKNVFYLTEISSVKELLTRGLLAWNRLASLRLRWPPTRVGIRVSHANSRSPRYTTMVDRFTLGGSQNIQLQLPISMKMERS